MIAHPHPKYKPANKTRNNSERLRWISRIDPPTLRAVDMLRCVQLLIIIAVAALVSGGQNTIAVVLMLAAIWLEQMIGGGRRG